MKIVWQLGTATVREVYEELLKSRKIAYTTVMTMMGILEQKGRLTKTPRDRAYVYSPTQSQVQVVGSMVHEFVKRVFDGSAKPLLVHLAQNKSAISTELLVLGGSGIRLSSDWWCSPGDLSNSSPALASCLLLRIAACVHRAPFDSAVAASFCPKRNRFVSGTSGCSQGHSRQTGRRRRASVEGYCGVDVVCWNRGETLLVPCGTVSDLPLQKGCCTATVPSGIGAIGTKAH